MRGLCIALFLAVALCVVAAKPSGDRTCSASPADAGESQREKRDVKTTKRGGAKTTKQADDESSEEKTTCNPAYAPKPGDKADVNKYKNKREANPADKKEDKKEDKKGGDKKGGDKDKAADDKPAAEKTAEDKPAAGAAADDSQGDQKKDHKHHCTGSTTEAPAAAGN